MTLYPLRLSVLLGLAAVCSPLASHTVSAQGKSGLIGHMFDERTNEAMTQGIIIVDSVRKSVLISSQGRFVISGLSAGTHRIELRAIGYRPYVRDFTTVDDQVIDLQFAMFFTGAQLPDIAVEARNSKLLPRFAEFEKRRVNGLGLYITREQIKAKGYMNMGDALKSMSGVKVDCGAVDCSIHMVRSTAGCGPTFYVDGHLARNFASDTPISDVQGIEVYRGAAEMPGEFAGAGSMCGVIAIWTRAAP